MGLNQNHRRKLSSARLGWAGRWVIIIFLGLLLLGWSSGKLLDLEAERVVHQLYPRDHEGIISGLQPIILARGYNKALILIHGFMESPDTYSVLVSDIKNRINMDIYVPRLPFHGIDLETASRLDNQTVVRYIEQYINDISKKYKSVTVVGLSYGGAVLTELARTEKLPANVNIILYAPAIFIKTNTLAGRLEAHVYGWWRKYCNYPFLDCNFPAYQTGDEAARATFDTEKTLRYKVQPAVLQLYQLDSQNREGFSHINRPYSLIVAVDDNRVYFDKQKEACNANKKYCHFYSFPSGKHIIHWGANKKSFEDLLIKLAS